MQKGLWSLVKRILADKRKHKLWLRIVSGMMALVVFCTTYALILPAVTMERKTYCGLEEHTHTEDCYATEQVSKKTLTCDPLGDAEFVIHSHNEFCYDDDGNLICDLTEREEHIHTEDCYNSDGELTCDLPEVEPHEHSDDCYVDGYLACGKPYVVEHQHTAECVQKEVTATDEKVLTCGKVEHQHTEECYEATDETTSGASISTTANTVASDKNTDKTAKQTADDKQTSATAVEDKEIKELTFAYSDDEISGVITLNWDAKLPSDLECTVAKLDSVEDDEDFIRLNATVNSTLQQENKNITKMQLYRLDWTSNGEEYTLPSTVIPKVQLTALKAVSSEAELMGVVISDNTDNNAEVFKDVSGINDLTDTEELSEISNTVLSAFSFDGLEDEVSDDTTSGSAIEADTTDKAEEDSAVLAAFEAEDYTAETVEAENDSVELELAGTSTFAVLRALSASTASNCYKRIDTWNDIDLSKSTLLVFENGPTCVSGALNSEGYSVGVGAKIQVNYIKGLENKPYVTVVDVDSGKAVTPTDFPLYNFYFNQASETDSYGNTVISYIPYTFNNDFTVYYPMVGHDYSTGWQFSYYDNYNAWWARYEYQSYGWDAYWNYGLQNYTRYLYYDESSNSFTITSYGHETSNMHIYQYIGSERDVYDDVQEVGKIENVEIEKPEQYEKPNYATYQTVSDQKSETAVLGEQHMVAGATLDCTSDPSTSQIESKFGLKNSRSASDQYRNQKKNDGRLITDKSVVYGKDDYSAIPQSDYDAGDFSVTLSALGQEWKTEETEDDAIPLDVVFIFDMSASMKYQANPSGTVDEETGEEITDDTERWQASTDAINAAMAEILDKNPNNRVGLVEFSNTSAPVLELSRYTATDKKYFTYQTSDTATRYACQTLKVDDSVVDEATGSAPTNAGKYLSDLSAGMYSQTYTQRGLQEAYELFEAKNDTTYYISALNKYVQRQPVIVLVTDGDPTFCTYNYMNPKEGPNYGVGASFGIEGYYTILSANYFKNLTSIHYNNRAAFYTIGMGILTSGYGNIYDQFDKYEDSYRRTVLDPTDENVAALSDYKKYDGATYGESLMTTWTWQDTSLVLQRLLREECVDSNGNSITNDQFTDTVNDSYGQKTDADGTVTYFRANADGYVYGIGYPSSRVRGLSNPYKDDYNYVDAAFFGNLSTEDLEDIFDSILQSIQTTTRYDFLLKDNTNVIFTDPLGDGMAVKGTPVLRYFGVNYTDPVCTTASDATNTYATYVWNKTVTRQESDAKTKDEDKTINLSSVVVKITTNNTTKAQTITLSVPDSALPTFYPDNYKQFYYEELPIRVIFRVGLSSTEETKLLNEANGSSIKDKIYYTNKYDDETAGATVTFEPADGNPYYGASVSKSLSLAKTSNPTATVNNYFTESVGTNGIVTQQLGNNGKLVLNRLNKSNVSVEKKWESKSPADRVEVELYATLKKYYAKTQYTSYSNVLIDTQVLSADNNWKYTWNDIDMDWSESPYDYEYTNFYVREVPISGYAAIYQDKNGDDLQLQEVTYTETDMSKLVVVTPPTSDEQGDETETEAGSSTLNAYSVGVFGFPVTVNAVAASNGSTVTITNKDTYLLPNSGGTGTTVFTLSGFAVMFAAIGLMYINKRRRNEQDNREAKY
jgi:LPXTG-motif cell wall-anchored protein